MNNGYQGTQEEECTQFHTILRTRAIARNGAVERRTIAREEEEDSKPVPSDAQTTT